MSKTLFRHFIFTLAIGVILLFSVACSGRMPSPKTSQAVAFHYFKNYGHKYKSSYFGAKNVSHVMINSVQEISYHFALVDAQVHFVDGHVGHTILKMEHSFPKGWHVVSWELSEYQ